MLSFASDMNNETSTKSRETANSEIISQFLLTAIQYRVIAEQNSTDQRRGRRHRRKQKFIIEENFANENVCRNPNDGEG